MVNECVAVHLHHESRGISLAQRHVKVLRLAPLKPVSCIVNSLYMTIFFFCEQSTEKEKVDDYYTVMMDLFDKNKDGKLDIDEMSK